jgi:hypothetical protein
MEKSNEEFKIEFVCEDKTGTELWKFFVLAIGEKTINQMWTEAYLKTLINKNDKRICKTT